jgi:hypothetical protein
MNRTAGKGRPLTPEVRHRGFIYTTFGLGASHMGLWAYGLGLDKKPAWPVHHCPGGPPHLSHWTHVAKFSKPPTLDSSRLAAAVWFDKTQTGARLLSI